MILKGHNALLYANRAVLWLNDLEVGDGTIGMALATSYRLSILTMSPSSAVWPQSSTERFKL